MAVAATQAAAPSRMRIVLICLPNVSRPMPIYESVYLFGASSMLGWSIFRFGGIAVTPFCNTNTRPFPPGIERGIDLDEADAVAELFARERPSTIICCAGVCDVEKCQGSPEFAWLVNVEGTRLLARHAPPDARLVY